MSERIFEFKTIKTTIIRHLFEVVKQATKENNIKINKNGVFITAEDTSDKCITHVKMDADKFESFECKYPVTIGLNIVTLFKALKTCNKKEHIEMYQYENDDKFCLRFTDPIAKRTRLYKLQIMTLDIDTKRIKEYAHEYEINLPTIQFQQIIKDINILDGKFVEIKSVGDELVISCDDGEAGFCTTIHELSEDSVVAINPMTVSQGVFNIAYLLNFIKASQLCDSMKIFLTNDEPLVIEYDIADMGKLTFVLLPFEQ